MDEKLYIEPFEGWRLFFLNYHPLLKYHPSKLPALYSLNLDTHWDRTDIGPAMCRVFNHTHIHNPRCPVERCSCGYYSVKNLRDLHKAAGIDWTDYISMGGYVLAKVAVWGRIVVGSNGYRSERQTIRELYYLPDPKHKRVVSAHAKRLGVPAIAYTGVLPNWITGKKRKRVT